MRAHLERILADEYERYAATHLASKQAHERARLRLPFGVGSSFQYVEPFPVTIARADGPWAWDADERRYLDLNMGFGALLVGHRHPAVLDAVERQLADGTLFVAPSELAEQVAAGLAERFGHPVWRFANSGTEATMTAVRVARAYTGRELVVKVEGGYHGHADTLLVSGKPKPGSWGPPGAPASVPDSLGVVDGIVASTLVVPYNDAAALERCLAAHVGQVAAFIVEPVLENAGIVLPQPGYIHAVRDVCDRHGVLLVFDEVKTGLTASWGGAAGLYGVTPDVTCLAKSIGGGFGVAAFGGREDVMRVIEQGCAHHGTYNANPVVLAAAAATLEVCTRDALDEAARVNEAFADEVRRVLAPVADVVPTSVQTVGVKGSITFAGEPAVTYRDWRSSDMLAAEVFWLWGTNRGVLTPPGLDEQWLVSLAHTPEALDGYLEQLRELVAVIAAA